MARTETSGRVWRDDGRWRGRLDGSPAHEVSGPTRAACLRKLRRAAGEGAGLTIEVLPDLAGVAEAAAIMDWDKRRVITYLDRGSFPEPFAALASGRVWIRDDVEAFAAAYRKRRASR